MRKTKIHLFWRKRWDRRDRGNATTAILIPGPIAFPLLFRPLLGFLFSLHMVNGGELLTDEVRSPRSAK